jgi:DNA repair protein RadD
MSVNEIEIIRRIGDSGLRELIGSSIVSAVEKSFNTNVETTLAKLVLLKYGATLLDSKKLRASLIDTARPEEVIKFAKQLGFESDTYFPASKWLRKYFATSYSEAKSQVFVRWLGLPDTYIKSKVLDERTEVETVTVQHGESGLLRSYLHGYQKDVKDQVLASLVVPGYRMMMQMPTGAGKTYTALETAVDILRRPFQKQFVVWIVNSNELAEQALQSFRDIWQKKGDREIDIFRLYKDFSPSFDEFKNGGVVFSSYDLFGSILGRIDDVRRESLLHLISQTQYLIVDEAHSAIAETYETCINAFISNDHTMILGLSATPMRSDPLENEMLRRLFSGNLVSVRDSDGQSLDDPIGYLQEHKYLAKIETNTLDTGFSSQETSERTILQALSEDSERNELIMQQIELANSKNDKTLVFACTLDHVLALFIMCESKGFSAGFIIGDTPQSERLKILDEFNTGDINVLINLEILSTGIDLPNLDRLILTRPVRSDVMYSQIVGRALRGPLNGGNERNVIVNILDNINYYSGMALLYDSFKSHWE